MPRTSISRFREFVRTLNYFVSIHAAEALEDDKLTILDLENIILTGEVVVKTGPTGRLVVITAYLV